MENDLHISIKTNDIRQKNSYQRKPCYVCKKHIGITELHHLVPLATLKLLINLGINVSDFKNNLVHLCPNHHRYMHLLLDASRNKSIDCSDYEWTLISELIDKRNNLLDVLRKSLKNE